MPHNAAALAAPLASLAQAGQGTQARSEAAMRADINARIREAGERAREAQVRALDARQAAQAAREGMLDGRATRAAQIPDAPRSADAPDVPLPPAPTRILVQDGHVIVQDGEAVAGGGSGELIATTQPPMGPGPNEIPPQIVEMAGMFFTMITIIAIGVPLIKLIGRWMERRQAAAPAIPADVTHRLERIEQAVETVAVEVERISEGQRFTTKLMAELRQSSAMPQLEGVRMVEPKR